MLGASLPVFAATDGFGGTSDKVRTVSAFPGEEPSDKELREWLKVNIPILRQTYGAAIRGVTPSHLIKYESGAAVAASFAEIGVGSAAAGTMTAAQIMMHNRRVAVAACIGSAIRITY